MGHNLIAMMIILLTLRVIITLEAEITRDSTALLGQGYLHSSASQCWGGRVLQSVLRSTCTKYISKY